MKLYRIIFHFQRTLKSSPFRQALTRVECLFYNVNFIYSISRSQIYNLKLNVKSRSSLAPVRSNYSSTMPWYSCFQLDRQETSNGPCNGYCVFLPHRHLMKLPRILYSHNTNSQLKIEWMHYLLKFAVIYHGEIAPLLSTNFK